MAHDTKKSEKTGLQKGETAHVLSPFEEMDRLFDSYLSRGWLRPFQLPSLGRACVPGS